jgi:hypothetical protein
MGPFRVAGNRDASGKFRIFDLTAWRDWGVNGGELSQKLGGMKGFLRLSPEGFCGAIKIR